MRNTNQDIINICNILGLRYDCLSSGPKTARIAIVADYPGNTEKKTKVPLSGTVGRYLWDTLRKIGLSRDNIYVTNVIKRCTDENERISYNEFSLYTEVLETELGSLENLEYILCLGSNALHALNRINYNISDWRGSVVPWRNAKAFFTYNPAYVLQIDKRTGLVNDPMLEVIFKMDIAKFKRLINGGYAPTKIETNVITTMKKFNDDIRQIELEIEQNPLSLDIEHIGPFTSLIGLSTNRTVGHVIALCTQTENFFSEQEEFEIFTRLCRLINNEKTRVIGQWVATDLCWLSYKNGIGPIPNVYGDTLLAHHLLYPTLPQSLAFLVSKYTWNPYYKNELFSWKQQGDINIYFEYNAKDTVNTHIIHEKLLIELEQAGLLDFYHNHVMHLTKHLCNATLTGIPIDIDKKTELEELYNKKFVEEKALLEEKAMAYMPEEERLALQETLPEDRKLLSSPQQLGELIYTHMGMPLIGRKTKTGKLPTDKLCFEKLIASRVTTDEQKQFCKEILALRKKSKFLSTYAKVKLDEDNRFRAFYNQTGVRTAPGRLSSSANQWGTAGNIQNQPEQSRSMFIAPDGYCFVYGDGSQAEARFVGWDAKIDSWKEDFEKARLNPRSFDCHRSLAAQIFNVPYEDVPLKDYDKDGNFTIRYLGKRARHGLNYRMLAQTFSERTGISLAQAYFVFNMYHKINPEIQIWWKWLEDLIKESKKKYGYGVLYNVFGRRLIILERLTDEALKSIVAFRPQSSIGDLLQRAWYKSHDDDEWPSNSRILINVHDSLTALCPLDKAGTVAKIMKRHAEEPMIIHGDRLIIPFELKVSYPDETGKHRWNKLKDFVI